MDMDENQNPFYGVNILKANKIGPQKWRARGAVFRKDTLKVMEMFTVEADSEDATIDKTNKEIKKIITRLGITKNWQE